MSARSELRRSEQDFRATNHRTVPRAPRKPAPKRWPWVFAALGLVGWFVVATVATNLSIFFGW